MLATPELIAETAQQAQLTEALPRVFKEVPLYRAQCDCTALVTPDGLLECFKTLPFITKADIRHNFPHNFLTNGQELDDLLDRELIELEHTSGTSEERTPLLLPRGWWAEQEARALRLNSHVAAVLDNFPRARRVTINSPMCSNDICYTGVPSQDDRVVGDALFVTLSRYPFLWGERDLDRMAAEAQEWNPQFLDVDPVYGVVFALHCERRGIRLPDLKFILCSYEFVSNVHRRILERVFRVPVLNLYGSTETGHLMMEVEPGRLAPSQETAFLEIINPDKRGAGDLVVTTLTNDFMPLVRYRISDLVQPLGQPYRARYILHGRTADSFFAADGRRITTWDIDQCFADIPGIAHYQLGEEARSERAYLLRFVPDNGGPTSQSMGHLRQRLGDLLGTSQLELRETDTLMPESSGKFRLGYPRPQSR